MQNRNEKKANKPAIPADGAEAYAKAQQLLKDRKEGYVPYDMILTSNRQIRAYFPKIVSGDLLIFLGTAFYWRRQPGEPLILFGKNEEKVELKERGLVEICRFRVPEVWVGAGRFRIDWPKRRKKGEKKMDESTLLLITLYLYSIDDGDFYRLTKSETAVSAFMVSLFLDVDNAELFNQLAEERFESLR